MIGQISQVLILGQDQIVDKTPDVGQNHNSNGQPHNETFGHGFTWRHHRDSRLLSRLLNRKFPEPFVLFGLSSESIDSPKRWMERRSVSKAKSKIRRYDERTEVMTYCRKNRPKSVLLAKNGEIVAYVWTE